MQPAPPFEKMYQMYIPCPIFILLLIHQIYFIISINVHTDSQALWFALWALPELLAVFLLAAPDLVPNKNRFARRVHVTPMNIWTSLIGV